MTAVGAPAPTAVRLDVAVVRNGSRALISASDGLVAARDALRGLATLDLGKLSVIHSSVVDRISGAAGVGADAATELHGNVDASVQEFDRTDHRSAGDFRRIVPPGASDH